MSDIFISYARSTAVQAQQIAEAFRAMGYGVWRDDELPAHRSYAEVIEERLNAAKAVVVIWSAEAAKSEWVQSEADRARAGRKLVQLTLDGSPLPMPFDRIQCADISGWSGDLDSAGWRKVAASVATLVGAPGDSGAAVAPSRKLSICVLPFANMSDDPQQEYFSDGISEDIITDLSKVSALSVVARNTAFTFKGKAVDVTQVARQLNVSHVLEGSIRKAGARVRITAQLIDGVAGDHVWAERYDRDLADIFALQDEISETIVKALKLKLLPEEKKAIERRGTDNVQAYDLLLMARRYRATANSGDPRREETTLRLCREIIALDPGYADAWAFKAIAESMLQTSFNRTDVDGLSAAERALALDPNQALAHAAMADHLRRLGQSEAALPEVEIALRLDAESFEVNNISGTVYYVLGRWTDAVRCFEKATDLMESDFNCAALAQSCYTAMGDRGGEERSALKTLKRTELALAGDPSNGFAMAYRMGALAALGRTDQAKDEVKRALLIDPTNLTMKYNLACSLCVDLADHDAALDLLAQALEGDGLIKAARTDPDLSALRDDPRFIALLLDADARLAARAG